MAIKDLTSNNQFRLVLDGDISGTSVSSKVQIGDDSPQLSINRTEQSFNLNFIFLVRAYIDPVTITIESSDDDVIYTLMSDEQLILPYNTRVIQSSTSNLYGVGLVIGIAEEISRYYQLTATAGVGTSLVGILHQEPLIKPVTLSSTAILQP